MTRYECLYCREKFGFEPARDRHEQAHERQGDDIHPAFTEVADSCSSGGESPDVEE